MLEREFMRLGSIRSRIPIRPPARPAATASARDAFNAAAGSTPPRPTMPKPSDPADYFAPLTGAIPPQPQQTQQAPPPVKHATFNIDAMKTGPIGLFLSGLDGSRAADVMKAAVQGDASALKALMAQHEVLPDFTNANGVTPLMAAAAQGHADIVELLASHPLVNLSRATQDGWTALHYAAQFGHEDVVAALLIHHAPMDAKIAAGDLPHMLAANEETTEAFWEDKNFRRFMKTVDPQNQRFQPPPEPVARPEEEITSAVLKASEELLLLLAQEAVKNPAGSERAQVETMLARMTPAEFTIAQGKLAPLGFSPDDKSVFIAAAGLDNAGLMSHLWGEAGFRETVLNRALSAAVRTGDNRAAVRRLVLWGASPDAPYQQDDGTVAKHPIHRQAFGSKRAGALEEMVLWSKVIGNKREFSDNRSIAQKAVKRAGHMIEKARGKVSGKEMEELLQMYKAGNALLDASELWFRKAELPVNGEKSLRAAFHQAVDMDRDIITIMAVYAESRTDRLLRGKVKFDKADGGGAIAVALLRGRFEFARTLIADGYKLGNAPAELQSLVANTGSEAAKVFAKEHLSGKMRVENMESAGKKVPGPRYVGRIG